MTATSIGRAIECCHSHIAGLPVHQPLRSPTVPEGPNYLQDGLPKTVDVALDAISLPIHGVQDIPQSGGGVAFRPRPCSADGIHGPMVIESQSHLHLQWLLGLCVW